MTATPSITADFFSRCTDRARKTMALANQEACRFNHEYIGTEHILLGLVKEGSGVGSHVLRNLDIDLRKVRLEVEKLVKSGPDTVTLGNLPRTPRATKVLEFALEEARSFQHNYIGTEHLLLGLMREGHGVAHQVLSGLGLNLDAMRAEVLSLCKPASPEGSKLTPTAEETQRLLAELTEIFSLRCKQHIDTTQTYDILHAQMINDHSVLLLIKSDSNYMSLEQIRLDMFNCPLDLANLRKMQLVIKEANGFRIPTLVVKLPPPVEEKAPSV